MSKIRKINLYKIVSMFIILGFLLSFTTVNAQNNTYYYSVRSQVSNSLEGTLDNYEDASKIKINNNNPLSVLEEVYIKNSDSTIWLGIRTLKVGTLVGIAVMFDVDHDQLYSDDGKVVFLNGSRKEGYFVGSSSFAVQSSINFESKLSQITYIDGSTNYLFEFKIPLDSATPTTDLQISDPSDYLLGFDVISIHDTTMFSEALGEISSFTSSATNYVTLILAGPGKFAIPDFEPDTISSSPPSSSSLNPPAFTSAPTDNKDDNANTEATAATPGFTIGIIEVLVFTALIIIFLRRKHGQ